jgi:hypothetical protein
MWVNRGVSTGLTFAYGVNVTELEAEGSASEIVNAAIVRTDDRWTSRSQGSTWRRETFLSLGAGGSPSEVSRVAFELFAAQGQATSQTSAVVEPVAGSVAYIDYNMSDLVNAVKESGVVGPQRVIGITVTEDTAGYPVYVPELGTL